MLTLVAIFIGYHAVDHTDSVNALQSSDYPSTAVVEIQNPETGSYASRIAYPRGTIGTPSTVQLTAAPLQISGQATLQGATQALSPTLEQPVGVHVVDSPQGKVG